jgi:raffinose/stachyose/melibiose transport system permease protein
MAALHDLARGTQAGPRSAAARRFQRALKPWLFLFPLLFFNVLVILGPSLGTIYFAFTDWSGVGAAKFTGLENFRRMANDPVFWRAFTNNLIWTVIFLVVPIGMGLLGAALVAPIRRGQVFFRTVYFIPYVIAATVNAQIWRNIFNPSVGLGVQLAKLGLAWADIKFFGDARAVLYAIAFVDNWHWWGFLVVIYLAAMQGVDFQLYEAARIEGATRWQEFRYVTLPGIRPTLIFTILITVIFSFLVFDYVYIITQGGPANASEVLSTMSYKAAFARFEAGYAAAIALMTSVICLLVGLIFVFLRRRGWEI